MIITTRYRDIPWEEASKCAQPEHLTPQSRTNWEALRGKPVKIESPAITEPQYKYAQCGGPFYRVEGRAVMVCPHIAMIMEPEAMRESNGYCVDCNSILCSRHAAVETLELAKDNAYSERDRLVAALSKLLPSHLAKHPASDTSWERDWMNIVCIHLPGPVNNSYRQATWHIHDSELPWFAHLVDGNIKCHGWDGHTTEEKYQRLDALLAGSTPRTEEGKQ